MSTFILQRHGQIMLDYMCIYYLTLFTKSFVCQIDKAKVYNIQKHVCIQQPTIEGSEIYSIFFPLRVQ